MNKEWELFEKTLDRSHWEKAQKLWSKLEQDGIKQPMLMAHTKELYSNQFSFPEISKNDEVVDILSNVEDAQNNLNSNPSNHILLTNFITASKEAISQLESKYGEFWTNPILKVDQKEI